MADYHVLYEAGTHVEAIYCPLCPWPPPGAVDAIAAMSPDSWLRRFGPTSYDRPRLAITWDVTSPLMPRWGGSSADCEGPAHDAMTSAYVWTWRIECDQGDGHILMRSGDIRDDIETPEPPTIDEVRQWLSDRGFWEVPADADAA